MTDGSSATSPAEAPRIGGLDPTEGLRDMHDGIGMRDIDLIYT